MQDFGISFYAEKSLLQFILLGKENRLLVYLFRVLLDILLLKVSGISVGSFVLKETNK